LGKTPNRDESPAVPGSCSRPIDECARSRPGPRRSRTAARRTGLEFYAPHRRRHGERKILAPFDALLFDFDGVLADSERIHQWAWNKTLEPLGIHLDWEFYLKNFVGV